MGEGKDRSPLSPKHQMFAGRINIVFKERRSRKPTVRKHKGRFILPGVEKVFTPVTVNNSAPLITESRAHYARSNLEHRTHHA